MRRRWVSHNPSPEDPAVGQAIVAGWWPTTYYLVSTLKVGRDSWVTQVQSCNSDGWPGSFETLLYLREYQNLAEARLGHTETVSAVFQGKLRLKKQSIKREWG